MVWVRRRRGRLLRFRRCIAVSVSNESGVAMHWLSARNRRAAAGLTPTGGGAGATRVGNHVKGSALCDRHKVWNRCEVENPKSGPPSFPYSGCRGAGDHRRPGLSSVANGPVCGVRCRLGQERPVTLLKNGITSSSGRRSLTIMVTLQSVPLLTVSSSPRGDDQAKPLGLSGRWSAVSEA